MKFTRHPHVGYVVNTQSGSRFYVSRQGRRWVAWRPGQHTLPHRTRAAACAFLLDPVGAAARNAR